MTTIAETVNRKTNASNAGYWTTDEPVPAEFRGTWVEDAVAHVDSYLYEFLGSRHPSRPGPVCPYMPAALRYRRVFYAVGNPSESERSGARRAVALTDALWGRGAGSPRTFRYSAAVIIYPSSTSQEYIDEVQYKAKAPVVGRGVMVGALHPQNNAESIRGGGFYPLRTPVPSIVLRDMVPSDLQFLEQRRFSPRRRIAFFRTYLAAFESSPLAWEKVELDKARDGLADCRRQVERRRAAAIAASTTVLLSLLASVITRASLRRRSRT